MTTNYDTLIHHLTDYQRDTSAQHTSLEAQVYQLTHDLSLASDWGVGADLFREGAKGMMQRLGEVGLDLGKRSDRGLPHHHITGHRLNPQLDPRAGSVGSIGSVGQGDSSAEKPFKGGI